MIASSQAWAAPLGQYHLGGVAAIVLGLYAFTLPHTPPPAKGQGILRAGRYIGLDALSLLREPSFAVFIVCSMLICIPLADRTTPTPARSSETKRGPKP